METYKIKEVYLANTKIEVTSKTRIDAPNWRQQIQKEGLYIITTANDLVVYAKDGYLFDVEKIRGKEKYELKFRERFDGKKNQKIEEANDGE